MRYQAALRPDNFFISRVEGQRQGLPLRISDRGIGKIGHAEFGMGGGKREFYITVSLAEISGEPVSILAEPGRGG